MKPLTFAAICLLCLPFAVHAQSQAPVHSPESVAAAILTGFGEGDVSRIAPHSNETNAGFFNSLLAGTRDPVELFDGTRGFAAALWDGNILPARYNGDFAYVPFAIEGPAGAAHLGSGAPGRYMAIVLELDGPEDTTWGFEDINFIDRAAYAGWSETRP